MEIEEFSKIFLNIACPYLLVMTPIALVCVFLAPNPPQDHVGDWAYVVATIICAIITGLSFWYCRTQMGWFGGRKRSKPEL